MGINLGFNGKVYYGTAGSARTPWGTPTNGISTGALPGGLTEMSSIRSVNDGDTMGEADGTTRASKGVKIAIPALQEIDVELEMPWQPADPGFVQLRAAYYGRKTIPLAIMDSDATVSGAIGIYADFAVLQFPREEPEDKEMMCKIRVKPGVSAHAPEAVTVS